VHLQPTKLSDAQVLPTSWLGGSTRGLQPGGHLHKVHLLSLQLASITSSGAFKPECNDLSLFREDTDGLSVPVREFSLSMPASPIELKNSLPDLDLNSSRREPSAQRVRPAFTVAYSVA